MDLEMELTFNNAQASAQADLNAFWGTNLDTSDSSYPVEVIDRISQDIEEDSDEDRSPPINIHTLTVQDTNMDYNMTGTALMEDESEVEYLLDTFVQARQIAGDKLDMNKLPWTELTGQLSNETNLNIGIVSRAPKEAGSPSKPVLTRDSDISANEEPDDGASEACELHTFWGYYDYEIGFHNFEDMDKESWDRVLKSLEETDEELEAEPESEPNKSQDDDHNKERVECPYCTNTYLNAKGLTVHVRIIHLGEVNYTCGQCDKGFYDKSKFNKHVRRQIVCTCKQQGGK
ncbi:hypothetical protein N431DRAFT_470001 [Stipitochalara longipes BDJ]|nr:hypothetical protein N431DRAFT_470001 [Stipitochalara longipes BDJ]